MADLLHDKIVLIGGNFDDRDQHLTPLSVSRDDLYTGLFIHTQILAQLLARRSVREMAGPLQWLIALVAGVAGYWLGRRSHHYFLWLELGIVVSAVLLGFLAFSRFSTILPYNFVMITLLAGAAVGHYGRVEREGIGAKKPAMQEGEG
jgi:CHASE2 domain-containing sensor protein